MQTMYGIVPLKAIPLEAVYEFTKGIKTNRFFQPTFKLHDIFRLLTNNTFNEYYCIHKDNKIVGIGFIRGWDENWKEKCLGIAILDSERGKGLGKALLSFLHAVARERKLDKIRLHCHPDNKVALVLYSFMGYVEQGKREDGELIMVKEL